MVCLLVSLRVGTSLNPTASAASNSLVRLTTLSGMTSTTKRPKLSGITSHASRACAADLSMQSGSVDSSKNSYRMSIDPKKVPQELRQYFEDAVSDCPENPEPLLLERLRGAINTWQVKNELLTSIITSKDDTITSKDIIITLMNKTIAEKDDKIAELTKEALVVEIKTRAKEASRIVLEDACRKYAETKVPNMNTFTDRYDHFKSNVLLSNNRLTADSEQHLKELALCGVDADPKQVKKELDSMVHILSRQFHVKPQSMDHGAFVGGDALTSATLAMCILRLQTLRHCDVDVTVMNSLGEEMCLLSMGTVTCIKNPQAPGRINKAQTPKKARPAIQAQTPPRTV